MREHFNLVSVELKWLNLSVHSDGLYFQSDMQGDVPLRNGAMEAFLEGIDKKHKFAVV